MKPSTVRGIAPLHRRIGHAGQRHVEVERGAEQPGHAADRSPPAIPSPACACRQANLANPRQRTPARAARPSHPTRRRRGQQQTSSAARHDVQASTRRMSLRVRIGEPDSKPAIEQTPTTLKMTNTAGFCSSAVRMCCCVRIRPAQVDDAVAQEQATGPAGNRPRRWPPRCPWRPRSASGGW